MRAGILGGRNLTLLLVLGALWGTAFMFISLGYATFGDAPILYAAYRFDIAGLAVLAYAWHRGAKLRPTGAGQWFAIGIAATLNVAAYHAFLFWGQRETTAGIAAVIVGLNPLLATVFSRWILPDERVGWHGALGLGLGLAGVVILATMKPGSLFDARGLGELAVLAAVASWALGVTLVKRAKHRMDVFAFTAWQMLVGAGVLHVAALMLERDATVRWNTSGVVALVYLAIVSSAVGFVIYFTLLERVGPIRANLVSHIAPAFATLAGFLVLSQPFEARSLAAFGLIALGFLLVARPSPGSRPPAAETVPPTTPRP